MKSKLWKPKSKVWFKKNDDSELGKKFCIYHSIARSQRKTEVERGKGHVGTMDYEHTGCYKCEGYTKGCQAYTPKDLDSFWDYDQYREERKK